MFAAVDFWRSRAARGIYPDEPTSSGRNGASRISWQRRFAVAALAICLFFNLLEGAAQVSAEYPVKAVFLFRFAEFVEWPPNAFPSPNDPLVFCVLGTNPFDNALHQAVRGESIGGHTLLVKELPHPQDIGVCHVLFISRSESAQIPRILAALKGRSILTVSDDGQFLAEGGMIQFVTEGNRVRFKINRTAAESAKLRLSSKLLRLAE